MDSRKGEKSRTRLLPGAAAARDPRWGSFEPPGGLLRRAEALPAAGARARGCLCARILPGGAVGWVHVTERGWPWPIGAGSGRPGEGAGCGPVPAPTAPARGV